MHFDVVGELTAEQSNIFHRVVRERARTDFDTRCHDTPRFVQYRPGDDYRGEKQPDGEPVVPDRKIHGYALAATKSSKPPSDQSWSRVKGSKNKRTSSAATNNRRKRK